MANERSWLTRLYWGLAVVGGIYAVAIGFLTHPYLQRHALYAHKLHTGRWWHNVSEPESFGFAKNQVTPFFLPTGDGEQLYCWHILPLRIYTEHEDALSRAPSGVVEDFKDTQAFGLLSADPESRVVINFHGNAGHVAQGYRTQTYQSISALPNTHILTCDYRGFGLSTGHPTEGGLIIDAVSLVSFVLHDLSQPASRTILLGQSLGTAVASAVTLFFLDPSTPLVPREVSHPNISTLAALVGEPTHFAATILVAPFTSLQSLLLTYRIGGVLPVLSPIRPWPVILRILTSSIVDTWLTLPRLQAAFTTSLSLRKRINLQILHSRDDPDINFKQAESLFEGIASVMTEGGVEQSQMHERRTVLGEGVRRGAWAYRKCEDEWVERSVRRNVELEITRFGGHNRIVSNAPVALAVNRAFSDASSLEDAPFS